MAMMVLAVCSSNGIALGWWSKASFQEVKSVCWEEGMLKRKTEKAGEKLVQNNQLELGPKSEPFPAHPDLDQLPANDMENSLGYSLSQSRQ
eukprot:10318494-Ditylum_brightwellii.AAC.1